MARMNTLSLTVIASVLVLAGASGVSQRTAMASATSAKTTLSFYAGAGLGQLYHDEIAAFEKKYPSIAITDHLEADANFNTVLPRTLASSSAPDISGIANLVAQVKDQLLTNLDSYATKYHWKSKLPATVLNAGRVNSSGVQGVGSLYEAGGNAGSAVGVFFNRALAKKVGLTSAPRTLAQFQAILARAKAKGVTPIIASNKDGLILHLHALLLGQYMGPKAMNAFLYHHSGATIDTPAAIQATTLLQKWVKAGYFNADANAIDQQASYGEFAGGKGLFMVQGSWLVPILDKSLKGKYGFFPLPPKSAGGKYTALSGNSLFFGIPAHAKNKDAAAQFLNFLTTKPAEAAAVKNGWQVASKGVHAPAPLSASLATQLHDEYSLVSADNGFHGWPVDSGPQMAPAWTAELQLLVAGRETPSGMMAKLQSDYKQ